jgi:histidine ammonia-lyase
MTAATKMRELVLRPGALTLEDLQAVHAGGVQLALDPGCAEAIAAGAAVVRRAAEGDAPVYGVNTGFGKLASKRISTEDLDTLQRNLIRSHSVGVGAPLAPPVVRLMLALKAASLARGHSGVRPEVIDMLLRVHDAGLVPCVPSQGSVGASGDLAPLAHMTLALMGEGEMLVDGARVPALGTLREAGIEPLVLQAKEGLALINGTQTSTALALHALLSFEPVLEAALVVGALTVDAAATARSIRASTSFAASPGRSTSRSTTAACSKAARSAPRTARATTACRTRTACAASRRWSAPAWTSCATPRWCWCARPMR